MCVVQCICQICVCGRHRCCGHKKEQVPFAKDKDPIKTVTENQERYVSFGFQPKQQPIRPPKDTDWKGNEPFVKLSITKKDYVPKPLAKRLVKKPKQYKQTKSKFTDCTTYRHDFLPKKGQRMVPVDNKKDATMLWPLSGKMQDETTYGRSYPPKSCQKREPVSTTQGTITVLGQPFTGETETKRCYQAPPLQKREPIVPYKGTLRTEGDFEGNTTHKIDYTPKYVVPQKPIKKSEKWKAVSDKFQDCTTHKHDFKCPPNIEKRKAIVPHTSSQKFEVPFEGISHYKKDFKPHEVKSRQLPDWHPSFQQHHRSSAPMFSETTYKRDYEAPPEDITTQKSKPLENNLALPSGPMERETTTMRDYRHICRPIETKSFKPITEYKKPEGRFADCSTTRHDYTPKTGEKLTTSKHKDNLQVEDGIMDDLTTTMKDFQWMCIDCPASHLKKFGKDALSPKYTFDKVEAGHQYFKKYKGSKKTQKT